MMNLKSSLTSLFAQVTFRSRLRAQTVLKLPSKPRRLRFESLENRELLSASSWNDASIDLESPKALLYEATEAVASSISESAELSVAIDELLAADGQDPENLTQKYIFGLKSLSTSTYTIYLDFNGHVNSSGTLWQCWGGYGSISTPAYSLDSNTSSFSNEELKSIYEIWLRVSEDFAPFNVNVTTVEPSKSELIKSDTSDASYGVRVCIGGSYSDWLKKTAGGVAYVDCFTADSDTPVYVFAKSLASAKAVAEGISHEVGHTLGLEHDGDSKSAYYSGANGWAPIMGYGGDQTLTQWSKGEYSGANNREDDLAIITSNNGFGYRSDDFGDSTAKAKTISVSAGQVCANGIIERNTDVDFFKFKYDGNELNLRVGGIDGVTNLDALVKLYDASGKVVQTFNPTDSTSAVVTMTGRSAGTYYLSVEGTGLTSGGKTIYTDYGSLGRYAIVATGTDDDKLVAPSDVTLGVYDPTTRRVAISWKDNSTNETGFRVEYSTDEGKTWNLAQIMGANSTSRVATGVKTNALYQFRVCALFGKVYSDWAYSEILDTRVKPTAPSDVALGAYNPTTRRVTITWNDNSTNETGFRVEYSSDGGKTWSLAEIMDANATSRVATGVKTNALYQFRVCALFEKNYSDWAYSVTLNTYVTPTAPSDLTLGVYNPTTRRVSLSWKDNSTNETGFRVEYSTDGGKTWRLAEIMDANETSRVATSVKTNAVYQFRVCALLGKNYSDWTYSEKLDTSVN